MNTTPLRYYLLVFIFFFITYAYFFQGGGWNQNGRICLTRAILHEHTFSIDTYREDAYNPFFPFVNTGDWSYYKGHYYTNKSPGLSLMALIPYAVAEYAAKKVMPSDGEKQVLFSAYVSNVCTTVVCGAMLCLTLFHVLTYFFQFGLSASMLLTLLFGVGTLMFSYSTTFYCHAPSACFAFLSFVLTMHIRRGSVQRTKTAALASGFCAACAVLIEPSTVLMLGAVFFYLVSFQEGRRCALFFLAGCVPPGLVQCFYNSVCFGSPFASSYEYANDMVMYKVNGKLFGLPSAASFAGLLILPYRGLFISSPVYLMLFPGIVLFFRQKQWRPEAIFCAAVFLFFIVYMAGFYAWYGGSAAGPRYLLPAFPFGFLLAVWAFRKFFKSFMLAGICSVLINTAITLVGNEIPREIRNPLFDVILKKILKGEISINPVPFSNFSNYPSIEALRNFETWMPNFNSFNLGEFLFPHHMVSMLPLLLFWLGWSCVWRRCTR